MELSKNLTLARQARAEDNSEDAKLYYSKVREENPENGEAKYFHAYYSLYEGTNGEYGKRFVNLCSAVSTSIKFVRNSYLPIDEQIRSLKEIVDSFVPETWSSNRYMNRKNNDVAIFSSSTINNCCMTGMKALKDLGDQIEALYAGNAECLKLAAIAWKEYVSLSQKWYAYAVKGDPELYASKIKKIEPSYEMPKKAGCISFADKK